jgi:hypothetical protein
VPKAFVEHEDAETAVQQRHRDLQAHVLAVGQLSRWHIRLQEV